MAKEVEVEEEIQIADLSVLGLVDRCFLAVAAAFPRMFY